MTELQMTALFSIRMQEKSAPFLSATTTELAQDQEERDELITYGKRDAAGNLFKISYNRLPLFESADAIFPGNTAPIIRNASSGERELVNQSWGFVLVMDGKAPRRVTNVRDDKIRSSSFWRGSFEERRCLVPASSFSEPKGLKPAVWHWFT